MNEGVKAIKKRQAHMFHVIGIMRKYLPMKAKQLTDDMWFVRIKDIYYFLQQDEKQYILSEVNGNEKQGIPMYNSEWVFEPAEVVQEIVNILGIEVVILINDENH